MEMDNSHRDDGHEEIGASERDEFASTEPEPASVQRVRATGFQFSIRTILVSTLLISVFCALCVAEFYFVSYCYLLALSFWLMMVDVVKNRVSRTRAAVTLAVAIIYTAGNIALFIFEEPFGIFDLAFMFSVVAACPAMAIFGAVAIALTVKKLHWTSLVGFISWVLLMAIGSLLAIGLAAASV